MPIPLSSRSLRPRGSLGIGRSLLDIALELAWSPGKPTDWNSDYTGHAHDFAALEEHCQTILNFCSNARKDKPGIPSLQEVLRNLHVGQTHTAPQSFEKPGRTYCSLDRLASIHESTTPGLGALRARRNCLRDT